jgi:hypothetical protein
MIPHIFSPHQFHLHKRRERYTADDDGVSAFIRATHLLLLFVVHHPSCTSSIRLFVRIPHHILVYLVPPGTRITAAAGLCSRIRRNGYTLGRTRGIFDEPYCSILSEAAAHTTARMVRHLVIL